MALGLNEFKKRFGKKPIDDVKPEDRFNTRFAEVKTKIEACMQRGDHDALKAWGAMQIRIRDKDWHGAADVLDEAVPTLSVDKKRAAKLRADLQVQAQRGVTGTGKLPEALKGAHDAVEAAIAADDYDDADEQLADFKTTVDDHLDDLAMWARRLQTVDGEKAEQVDLRGRAQGFNTPELTQAATAFRAARSRLTTKISSRDFAGADNEWLAINSALDKLLAKPADGSPEALKSLYESRRAAARPQFDAWVPLAGSGEPVLATHQAALGELKAGVETADAAFGNARYTVALEGLDAAIAAVPALKAAVKTQNDQLGASMGAVGATVKKALDARTVPPSVPATIDQAALKKAYVDRAIAMNEGNFVKAVRMFKLYEAGFRTIHDEIVQNPPPVVVAPVSPKVAQYQQLIQNPDRAAITKALNAPDADLAAFRAQPGAATLLDDMVGEIGGKADSKEKREFVQAAMKARFGLKSVTGGEGEKGMSSKALPRMYKLFALLPPEHTTDNEFITSVERQKAHDTSWHSPADKQIVLKAGKAGKAGGTFDTTTLHEIGHGVDLKFKFMATNGKARKFGGWQVETKESVITVAGEGLKFYSHFEGKNVARSLLQKYLELVVSGSDPKTLQQQFGGAKDQNIASPAKLKDHAAVKHAAAGQQAAKADTDLQRDLAIAARKLIKDREPIKSMAATIAEAVAFGKAVDVAVKDLLDKLAFTGAVPADAIWREMEMHPAIDLAANAGLKGGSRGLWDQGDSGAARCAVNGRVYQEAYSNTWVSYLLSARKVKVSDYQFRHQMEWFSECYALFFVDKLPPSHPLAPWLREQKKAAAPKT